MNTLTTLEKQPPRIDQQATSTYVTKEHWVCGTNFAESPPPLDGDAWKKLNDLAEKFDNETCKGWTEEIGNLLIFTGLFTATVTAFVVESYQWLQDDPTEQSVILLGQIVDRLTNLTNPIPGPPPVTSIATEPIEAFRIRVNVLWFLSLILSLSTVLAGILCTQWLREFQRDTSMLQRDNIPVRFLRFRGLQEWKVPQIISALPVLLQLSVILFFVGIIDLLWHLHPTVAPIATAIVSATMFFLLFTSLAPSLHFLASYGLVEGHLPAPCPYKSPQAALYRLIQSFEGVILALDRLLHVKVFRSLFTILILPLQIGVPSVPRRSLARGFMSSVKNRYNRLFKHVGSTLSYQTWVSMDKYWHKEDSWHRMDTAGGISWIMKNYGHRVDVFAWVVHAMDTLEIEDVRVLSQNCNPDHERIEIPAVDATLALSLENEFLSLGVLLSMPLDWNDARVGFRNLMQERIIRCINTDPELSGKLIPLLCAKELHYQEFMPFLSKNLEYRGIVYADSLLSFYASACQFSPGQLRTQVTETLENLVAYQGGLWNMLRYLEILTEFLTKSKLDTFTLMQEIRSGWTWVKEWYLSKLSNEIHNLSLGTRTEITQLDGYLQRYCSEIRTFEWVRLVSARAEGNTPPKFPATIPQEVEAPDETPTEVPTTTPQPDRQTPSPMLPEPAPPQELPIFIPPRSPHDSGDGTSSDHDVLEEADDAEIVPVIPPANPPYMPPSSSGIEYYPPFPYLSPFPFPSSGSSQPYVHQLPGSTPQTSPWTGWGYWENSPSGYSVPQTYPPSIWNFGYGSATPYAGAQQVGPWASQRSLPTPTSPTRSNRKVSFNLGLVDYSSSSSEDSRNSDSEDSWRTPPASPKQPLQRPSTEGGMDRARTENGYEQVTDQAPFPNGINGHHSQDSSRGSTFST